MQVETNFVNPGALKRPGPVGRFVRLFIGIWIVHLFYQLLVFGLLAFPNSRLLISWQIPSNLSLWIAVGIFFWLFPYVVNIGFSQNWRHWPQWILLGVVIIFAGISFGLNGHFWSPALGWIVLIWLLYVTGHLGFAFLLSAILATPGCEMRSFHHLWTIITGRKTHEHCCPGFLDKIDKWEARQRWHQSKSEISS